MKKTGFKQPAPEATPPLLLSECIELKQYKSSIRYLTSCVNALDRKNGKQASGALARLVEGNPANYRELWMLFKSASLFEGLDALQQYVDAVGEIKKCFIRESRELQKHVKHCNSRRRIGNLLKGGAQ